MKKTVTLDNGTTLTAVETNDIIEDGNGGAHEVRGLRLEVQFTSTGSHMELTTEEARELKRILASFGL